MRRPSRSKWTCKSCIDRNVTSERGNRQKRRPQQRCRSVCRTLRRMSNALPVRAHLLTARGLPAGPPTRMACILTTMWRMAIHDLSSALLFGRRRFASSVALTLCVTAGVVTPAAADSPDDGLSGGDSDGATDEQSSASTALSAATVEESSDWREILPGLTMGSQLRLRTESRRNARFDRARPGNDEDYLLSRFRVSRSARSVSRWATGDSSAARTCGTPTSRWTRRTSSVCRRWSGSEDRGLTRKIYP